VEAAGGFVAGQVSFRRRNDYDSGCMDAMSRATRAAIAMAALLAALAGAPAAARVGGTAEEFQRDFARGLHLTLHERVTRGLAGGLDALLTYVGQPGSYLAAKVGLKRGKIVSQSMLIGIQEGDREHAAQAIRVLARFFQEAADLEDRQALEITSAMMKQAIRARQKVSVKAARARLTLSATDANEGTMWRAGAEK